MAAAQLRTGPLSRVEPGTTLAVARLISGNDISQMSKPYACLKLLTIAPEPGRW
jgi:hypothetical protein